MNTASRLIISASLISLSACANVTSQDLSTSGIFANITVSNNDVGGISVSSTLTAGSGLGATYVDLSGGDALSSLYLGAQKSMVRHKNVLGIISYDSTYNSAQPYGVDNMVTVSFNRPSHQDAPNSYVTLPDPIANFAISATSVTVDQSVSVNWDTIPGKSYSLEVNVSLNGCKNAQGETSSISSTSYKTDNGSHSFVINNILSPGYTCPSGSTGIVTVRRVRNGTIDPAYDGGIIKAKYIKTVGITIQ